MKPEPAGYIAVECVPPFKGLDSSLPSNRIGQQHSPKLQNVVVRDGVVRRRPGGQQLGQRLVGRVLALTEFGPIGENPSLVALTEFRQYAYDELTNEFIDLTDGQVEHAITVVDQTDDYFRVAGNQTAYFTGSRLFPVVGSTGNDGVYTVDPDNLPTFGGGATTIYVLEEIPDATVDGDIVVADELTTQDTDFIDFAALTDVNGRRLLITNGRDAPLVWDGVLLNEFVAWAPNFPDFVTCKTLCVFNEHLFLGGVTALAFEPQLIAWSNAGDFDEFNSVSGSDGAQILYQLKTGIIRLHGLGDRLAVYSSDGIMTGIYVGLPAVFAFELVIPEGTRLVGHHAVASVNVGHVYFSDENVYLFDGTRGLRPLGRLIYQDYKDVKSPEDLWQVAGLNDYSKSTLYFSVPDVNGTTTIYTMFYDVFDLTNLAWAKEVYRDKVTAWGFYVSRSQTTLWEDTALEAAAWPSGEPWSEEIGNWFEEGEQVGFPARIYGTDEGYVVLVTESKLSDRGVVARLQEYETADFTLPGVDQSLLVRWGEIEFEGWGQQVNVIVSTDKGRSYQGIQTVVLNDSKQSFRLPIDKMSRTLRVRFVTSGSDFSIGWVRLWGRPGGPG